MRLFGMIFMLLSIAPPVVAQEDDPPCDELWFARNLLFDRAGHCFDSTLGQVRTPTRTRPDFYSRTSIVGPFADCESSLPRSASRVVKMSISSPPGR